MLLKLELIHVLDDQLRLVYTHECPATLKREIRSDSTQVVPSVSSP